MGALFDAITAEPNLLAAWRQVRRAGGCPGLDRQGLDAFEAHLARHLKDLSEQLRSGAYRPLPLQRFYLRKRSGGLRPIGVPTVRDRIAQAAAVLQLQPLLEPVFLACSYAYRPGRSWLDAVNALCRLRDRDHPFVLEADIDRFFDTLSHERLLSMVRQFTRERRILNLIQQWLRTPVCDDGHLLAVSRGVPQGAVISPLLSNLYLHPFDERVTQAGLRLIRYADDFVIACRHEAQAQGALELVDRELRRLDLRLELSKTRVSSFAVGFEFLGTRFRGRDRTLPAGAGGYWDPRAEPLLPPQPLPPERLRHLWQDSLLPLHLVEVYAYCPRAAGLRLLTDEDPQTPEMAAGRAAEQRRRREVRRNPDAALTLERAVVAARLGLQGLVDAVEQKWGALVPVEYRWSWSEEVREPVALKLTAAALALEEVEGAAVPLGYVEFLPRGRREPVEFTVQRRDHVLEIVTALQLLLREGELPAAEATRRCQGCSLCPACLPEVTQEFAALLAKMIGGP